MVVLTKRTYSTETDRLIACGTWLEWEKYLIGSDQLNIADIQN